MRVFRCFPWNGSSKDDQAGGPFFIARERQGSGRYDIPDVDGVLYLCQSSVGAVAEKLQGFRGARAINARWSLSAEDLKRNGLDLSLAAYDLDGSARLADLNDPKVLTQLEIKPSDLGTPDRKVSQLIARKVFDSGMDGFTWPSNLDAQVTHMTLFQTRAKSYLKLTDVHILNLKSPEIVELRLRWSL